ncbi:MULTISPECIES: phosphate acetyltransferase [unclassified Shewanella]|uniref:phosphate acetyltransferase n=1 Tax=unclassified Shewanella TaxID=196818 RepID=UPI000C8305DB|nr:MULTISPECIES: phosphate acetyltransferase [unclassified Shewanella]MDO6619498.1 phosphate acetyltransferase [Shewanella sp. 6_MG-2023]MDO6639452.1 phosphate acetyltransferase [Shewanella sp. 5_MG-2023]MDO6678215.1 phosphate acetyltransferase [Shewanella sp. 4_MG-2023]MDO6775952.1 phosphate acetyltransferase [Shewanella sp. 3_MG-2023]PMG30267.1 phosphate acetyltransferase [Shewanella sp. 10N.286.52.C2]
MSRNIMLIPIGTGVGLTSLSLGMVRALERKGVKVQFFKPIAQIRNGDTGPERSTTILSHSPTVNPLEPFSMEHAENLIRAEQIDVLMEQIIARASECASNTETIVIEGLVPTRNHPFSDDINFEIAKALDADIIFIATPGNDSPNGLMNRLEIAYNSWGGVKNKRLIGSIINKIGAPVDEEGATRPDLSEIFDHTDINKADSSAMFQLPGKSPLRILGSVPYNLDLVSPRASDLAKHLHAKIINAGEMNTRRLRKVTFCARSIPNMVTHMRTDSLLVTSGDRSDVIVAACLAAMNGVKIGALLLTGGYEPEPEVMALCERAFDTGLPVFLVDSNTWQTSLNIQRFDHEVPVDDAVRIDYVQEYVASHIDQSWIESVTENSPREHRLSPPAFRYKLTELARAAKKTIVLPEGEEPRTIKAAAICAERGIARCVLLGNAEEIQRIAASQDVVLGEGVQIIDPLQARERYVEGMLDLRRHKGLTEVVAKEQLEDNMVLGTMMLAQDEVDGIVSGAVNTTANTIRPPLQLIKTAPGSSLVSSIFFMLMPDQVLVYGDCAINPDPNPDQLADIAIQSAESAAAFGIEPRVAMISYSTGTSGTGSDVDKVREATRIAKEKRPDLVIDGPLQYDAAVMENVARSKAPNSPVAGKATVFVFPDLNTGNTTYKAVQRSADLISIGPMLQGMRKPVNDLSRGALVDDIVYTIALTAIQAKQNEQA